jgi:uncharacterized membrane protein
VRRKSVGSISFVLISLMVIVYYGAYLTGSVDAEAAKGLSTETKNLLTLHKNGGIWMVYAALIVLILKLISSLLGRLPVRIIYLLMLGLFFWSATGVVQKGCALTYKHGVNVKSSATPHESAQPSSDTQSASEASQESAAPAAATAEAATEEPSAKTAPDVAPQSAPQEDAAHAQEEPAQRSEAPDKTLTQTVKEKATQAVETVKEEANKAVQKVHETLEKATQPQIETPAQTPPHPSEPIQTPMPVETPPAG